MSATLEITTAIGCLNQCDCCPQALLSSAYRGARSMALSDFRLFLATVPTSVQIDFSGFCEPWQNPECTEMLVYAHRIGYPLAVYTTLRGMAVGDWDTMASLPYKRFCVHLPDAEGHMGFQLGQNYLEVLESVQARPAQNMDFVALGNSGIAPGLPIARQVLPVPLHGRAGNVLGMQRQLCCGSVRCIPTSGQYDHNVLLPNGDVVLCCMDYGLRHVLGNLCDNWYATVMKSRTAIKELARGHDYDLLCRRCTSVGPQP